VQTCLAGSDEAVSMQFLKAEMVVEQMQGHRGSDAAALAILTPLLKHTTHPLAARIAALHQALASLKSPRA
jgi:hypothetical protein